MSNPSIQPTNVPSGWEYDPAGWSQRLPIAALAMGGFGIATYLTLWQYGAIEQVWEPFFSGADGANGTETVLDSRLSRPFVDLLGWQWLPFPITDAALGAAAYLADAVTGVWGGPGRWRRIPWLVIIFAILVGPLGAISVALVISQPLLVDAWCTLCLASALVSALMIGPAMDEALASCQHLKRVASDPDRSAWKAFWGYDEEAARWRFW